MRAGSKKKRGQEGQKVATWIVSYCDMVTLLLAFFVLLQAFAHDRDPELFYMGQGSFLRAIQTFGLSGFLFGKQDRPKREYTKVKHATEEAKAKIPRNKVIDAEDEAIREVFQKMKHVIDTRSAELPDILVETTAAPIRFQAGQADLDRPAKEWLSRFALDLRDSRTPQRTRIHVMGFAPDVTEARQQWLLSAKRARAVADFLLAQLSPVEEPSAWELTCRGGGPGTDLARKFGGRAEQSFVVIAIEGER